MIKSKDTEQKTNPAKRNITVTDVEIKDGKFTTVDEFGEILDVVEGVEEKLPEGVTIFDIKISIELPEELDSDVDISELEPDED